jgi:hypothetical protein
MSLCNSRKLIDITMMMLKDLKMFVRADKVM